MLENVCLQCSKVPSGPPNRLVRDSCGHKKCRVCLLEDEHKCKQCEDNVLNQTHLLKGTNKLIKHYRSEEIPREILLNNHTGVIQVNGNIHNNANIHDEIKFTPLPVSNTFEDKKPDHIFSENNQNNIKVENKNIAGTKIKKPDKKKSVKRSYSSVIIPKHVKTTLDPLTYYCTICRKSFTTKTHVKYHVYCTGAAKPYKCEVCGKEFILRSQLDVHSYKHKSSKPYKCQICTKAFTDRSKLTRHSTVHTTVRSHICSICGNAYRSKESLKIHSITHKSEKPYQCKICDAKFSNQSNLIKHGSVHKKEKSHMCDLCGKRYKQKWALTVHKSSHLRGKIFECTTCLKRFNYKKDLQRHQLIHDDTKQYKCSICLMTFRRRDNLRRHVKNTHPGKKGQVLKNVVSTATNILPTSATSATTIQKLSENIDYVTKKDNKPVDNPNAIHVITSAAPAFTLPLSKADADLVSLPSAAKSDSRAVDRDSNGSKIDSNTPTSVINGPIKLAFKTPAFKSHYNINRNFSHMQPVVTVQNTYNMAESVEICQKIMSTDTSLPARNIILKDMPPASTDICKKILDSNPTRPLHYETSFQNKKHAMIKNIKFKVPIQYTNQFNNKEGSKKDQKKDDDDSNHTNFMELRPASVIVNSNDFGFPESENLHWRRRTSQNLTLKNLE